MINRVKTIGIIVSIMLACLLTGCSDSGGSSTGSDSDYVSGATIDPYAIEPSSIETFESASDDICREDGKPVIRMFSSSQCSHCQWVSDAFDAVVKMYVEEGLIVAHHWEINSGDDTLTGEIEQGVPDTEMEVYDEFSQGYVPTFVFGCRYYRVGTAYEQEDDLEAEAAEFMAVIEELISI